LGATARHKDICLVVTWANAVAMPRPGQGRQSEGGRGRCTISSSDLLTCATAGTVTARCTRQGEKKQTADCYRKRSRSSATTPTTKPLPTCSSTSSPSSIRRPPAKRPDYDDARASRWCRARRPRPPCSKYPLFTLNTRGQALNVVCYSARATPTVCASDTSGRSMIECGGCQEYDKGARAKSARNPQCHRWQP
jgi:hypothetical protein